MNRGDGGPNSRLLILLGGAVAVAGLAVSLTVNAYAFTQTIWIVTACASIAMALVVSNVLPIRGLRMRRTGLNAEAVFLDVSIAAPLFAFGAAGATGAAIAIATGFLAASWLRRSKAPTDILRHGVVRVMVVVALVPFAQQISAIGKGDLVFGNFIFFAALATASLLFVVAISAPISAATYHIAFGRVLKRTARDPRTWIVAAGNIVWATIVRDMLVEWHVLVAIAMWLPVVITSLLLRTIDEQHAELHRLRLVRDAVQAMLGDRDPLPQINAILATLRVPSFDETVTVLAATSTRMENWRTVSNLGPALSPAGDELRRRVLVRMKFSGHPSITLRDEYYVCYAFGARSPDGDLHGALVVHRRNDRALSTEQIGQFTNAAHELAPLLRDMRTIAAAQSAATIDALTGLYNRAATMDRLQTMLDELAIPDYGAILLLDIDHFKMINDQLGHAAGDDCLRKIGDIIRTAVRAGDTAGRIGGEEFLVVMPGASRDVALTVGERLRLAVALGGMRYATGEPVTTSIGVASAAIGDTMETLLARADRGLYEAKNGGRNRIIEATDEIA